MAESSDALIDTYLSDQWRIHGGPRRRELREELRDKLIPIVIKLFGSIDLSLDILLKESPCSNGRGIRTLIRAYALYCLRAKREALEAHDTAREQLLASFETQFQEVYKFECESLGTVAGGSDEVRATLRTEYCRLPMSVCQSSFSEELQSDPSGRPLGNNPFAAEHPAYDIFEEATWKAKEALSTLKSELLQSFSNPPFNFIQSILTFRVRGLSACANAALSIVGNEETAEWYENWIKDFETFILQDTLRKGQLRDPQADPGSPPLFTPELLPRITVDLQLQLMRVVEHYKGEAAKRVLQIMELRGAGSAHKEESPSDGTPSGTTTTEGALEDVVDFDSTPHDGGRLYRRSGDFWELSFGGKPFHVRNSKGLIYIAELLRSPGKSFGCLELRGALSENPNRRAQVDHESRAGLRPVGLDRSEILDDTARKQYKDRLDSNEKERREAELNNDPARYEQLTEEREAIIKELKAATGLGGRHRTFASDAEKARKAVSGAINDALTAIRKHHAQLAKHLDERIDRGVSCCYKGDGIEWEL